MGSQEKLVKQYSGDRATDYDTTRVGSARYLAEEQAFERLWSLADPRSVFDLPVGTGRWLPWYAAKGVKAVGVDASADMLRQAGEKLRSIDEHAITLIQADAYDLAFFEGHAARYDLVACVRFLNWIPSEKVPLVVRNLDLVAGKNLLLGIGFLQGEPGSLRRLKAMLTVWWVNLERRRRGRWLEHVHDRDVLSAALLELGWREVERIPIFSKKGRDNFFILYERPQGPLEGSSN